jgi:hypothetical protein
VSGTDLERLGPYLPAFAEGALLFAGAHWTPPEDVALLAAICLRETEAGWAPGYRPQRSPDGTGDWCARVGHWTRKGGVLVLEDADKVRAAGFALPKKKGQILPGPYAIPADREGWGRALFQIDALGDFADLVMPAPWPVERQAAAACAQLHLARQQLMEAGIATTHPLFLRCVVARYNTSLERVLAGLAAGDPDISTTIGPSGKPDYSRDVLGRRDALRARYPTVFPVVTGVVI